MSKQPTIKVYGLGMSTCTRRVLATLIELGLSYEIIPLDFAKGEHKQQAHLSRQPFGKIPCLEDTDGFQIFESRAIIRYLVHKYSKEGKKLLPEDPKSFGLVEQWSYVESENFAGPISAIVEQLYFKKFFQPGVAPDQKVVDENNEKLDKVVTILDSHLAKNKYFAGDHFTLADIQYLPYTEYLIKSGGGDVLLSKPHFAAWWKRVSERESWIKVTQL